MVWSDLQVGIGNVTRDHHRSQWRDRQFMNASA